MTPTTLHYVLVLDRSGSMANRMEDVIGAVNEQLNELRRTAEETGKSCRVTIVRFDDQIDELLEDRDVRELAPISPQDVHPRGCTALIDAVVTSIERTAERTLLATLNRTASVALVVYTDGGENASQLRTAEDLKRALAIYQNLEAWDIAFIGADPNAIATMKKAGLNSQKMAYVQAEKSHYAMRRMSSSLRDKLSHAREFDLKMDLKDLNESR